MTIKKAVLIGTLGAILVGLTAFAIKNEQIKAKTTTPNAENITPPKKRIQSTAYTDGWDFYIEPTTINDGGTTSNDYYTNKTETTTPEKPTNLNNTNWQFQDNPPIPLNSDNHIRNLNFTSTNADSQTTTYTEIAWDADGIAYITSNNEWFPAWYYEDGWYSNSAKYITFGTAEGNNNPELIDFIWEISTQKNATITFLATKKTETKTTNYNSVQYLIMNQKYGSMGNLNDTAGNNITSEGLMAIKIQSQGYTNTLNLNHLLCKTGIPNITNNPANNRPIFNLKFSLSTTRNFQLKEQDYNKYKKYEEIYNNFTKTNIYTGNYTWSYTMGSQFINSGQWSNETGTRIITFSNVGYGINASDNITISTIENSNINIMTGTKVNYILVYFKAEITNFSVPTSSTSNRQQIKERLYTHTGYFDQIEGYAQASTPITPPDIEDGNFLSLTGLMLNILSMPFTFLSQAFNLTLWSNTPWAFNIKNFIFTIIAILAFMFIIKLFTSGFSAFGMFADHHSERAERKSRTKLNKQKYKENKQKAEKTKPKKE